MAAISSILVSAALLASACAALAQGVGDEQRLGQRFEILPGALPGPYEEKATRATSKRIERGASAPVAPAGFMVSLFAEGLRNPRKLLVLDNGDVLLAEQKANVVTLLRDADGDGTAETVSPFATGFSGPFGMAIKPSAPHAGDLLVADMQGIWRVPFASRADGVPVGGERQRLTARGAFGTPGGHSTRSLAIDPKDGTMYVGIGSAGNIDEEPSPRATVQAFDPDGGNRHTFAAGTRNPVGLHFQPQTGRLWTVVQERDGLGNDLVPDYMTDLAAGDFYGWPYAFDGGKPMPGFAERAAAKVAATKMPKLLLQAHSSAMDFAFVPDNWPPDYRGDAILALRGSWNRVPPTGYKLVRAKFENGEPAGWYENFLTGFWASGTDRARVWGRPASVAFLPDGGLLVADDTGGTVWKVSPPSAEPTGAAN